MVESDKKKYLSDYPKLMAEWHPTKNGDLTPYTILLVKRFGGNVLMGTSGKPSLATEKEKALDVRFALEEKRSKARMI